MSAQSRIVPNVSIVALSILAVVVTAMTASPAHAENGVDVTYYEGRPPHHSRELSVLPSPGRFEHQRSGRPDVVHDV